VERHLGKAAQLAAVQAARALWPQLFHRAHVGAQLRVCPLALAGVSISSMPFFDKGSTLTEAWVPAVRHALGVVRPPSLCCPGADLRHVAQDRQVAGAATQNRVCRLLPAR